MKLSLHEMAAFAAMAGLPGDPYKWAAIGMAESSGDTDVVNSIGCVGIWQINQPVHVKAHPTWTVKWLQNPLNNARAAKVIYDSQGFNAWEAYTGPDGRGDDGPWRQHYKKGGVVKASDDKTCDDYFSPDDPAGKYCVDEGETPKMPPTPGEALDALESIPEALKKTADVLVNPRTWLRVAYGVGGAVLVLGGLFLLAEKSVGITSAGRIGKAIRGSQTGAGS